MLNKVIRILRPYLLSFWSNREISGVGRSVPLPLTSGPRAYIVWARLYPPSERPPLDTPRIVDWKEEAHGPTIRIETEGLSTLRQINRLSHPGSEPVKCKAQATLIVMLQEIK